MELYTGKYGELEFCAKKIEVSTVKKGKIILWEDEKKNIEIILTKEIYHFFTVPLKKYKRYTIELENALLEYTYLSGNDDIVENGVGFLKVNAEKNKLELVDMSKWHDSPIKEQYHFIPFQNWLNDPNGLCYYQNNYHMFYQANPTEQKADFCYWGHAVSKDLIHWKYMPLAVFPQEELLENEINRGGAFSGSAIVQNDELNIFFTRHAGRKDNLKDFCEYQVRAVSQDGIRFYGEEILIANRPENGMSYDFRDPKVTSINGRPRLVLAGSHNKQAAIFEYTSDDYENWNYRGILLKEEKAVCFECPDLFELNGKTIVIGALMDYTDENGRFRPTAYYIGSLEHDTQFHIEKEGILDFGLNFYAAQSFCAHNRRIMIGWIADFNEEHIFMENGCYGSMSIPRELSIQNHKLYMRPVQEIYQLLGEEVNIIRENTILSAKIPGNSYYLHLKIKGSCLAIQIAENQQEKLEFQWKDGVAEIFSSEDQRKKRQYSVRIEQLLEVELFFDRKMVEIFLNNGEYTGTRLFYTLSKTGQCRIQVKESKDITKVELHTMKSIWRKEI